MEDALALSKPPTINSYMVSLNPCFNGRCTRTFANGSEIRTLVIVLILVLMEDALAPYKEVGEIIANYLVLILVLMEDALALFNAPPILKVCVLILVLMEDALALDVSESRCAHCLTVLILVLMEDALAQMQKSFTTKS